MATILRIPAMPAAPFNPGRSGSTPTDVGTRGDGPGRTDSAPPTGNRLLDRLSEEERRDTDIATVHVHLERGQVLYAPAEPAAHAWFPGSASVSIQCEMQDGSSGETALVGNEGVVGWSLLAGRGTASRRAVVVHEGEAWRMATRLIDAECRRAGPLLEGLLDYAQVAFAQTAQLMACNRHHRLDQQLCRMLLSDIDRTDDDRLDMTHERMAGRLGVRREGVTAAARVLREAGAIDYRRGHLQVLDRAVLERRSCECYDVISKGYARLWRETPDGHA